MGFAADHQWSQRHLSHYVEGELSPRARSRLDRHARDCVECGRGLHALRALLHLVRGLDGPTPVRAPGAIFDRIRPAGGSPAPQTA